MFCSSASPTTRIVFDTCLAFFLLFTDAYTLHGRQIVDASSQSEKNSLVLPLSLYTVDLLPFLTVIALDRLSLERSTRLNTESCLDS